MELLKISQRVVAALALAAIALALFHLRAADGGITVSRIDLEGTPVTIFRPVRTGRPPVVVLAHGFAGSQQLMQAFATTFARAGYVAVTFDFLGHGRNPRPLTGSITKADGATRTLVVQTARVCAFARGLGDGRLAILGHSMASDIVVRVAEADPGIAATIAVSMFSPAVTRAAPRNLLVIAGAWESMLRAEALKAVGKASAPAAPVEGVLYGRFADGTARRAAISPHVEHVSVLYSQPSMAAALSWLDGVFGIRRVGAPYLDGRGPWILLLIAGVTALAWPLSRLLPVIDRPSLGAGLGWRAIWPCLAVPALATPIVLRFVPMHFLPILVGDYLAAHFALYGLLSLLCLRWRGGRNAGVRRIPASAWRAGLAALALTLYGAIGLGWPIDAFVTSFVPVGARLLFLLAMLVGTACYFLSDEWLTRGTGGACGVYIVSKVAFVLSLAIAVALDFERLFFLVIIVPVIIVVLGIYGLFSGWSYRRTGNPLVGGAACAIAFAWAIAVTFPMIAA